MQCKYYSLMECIFAEVALILILIMVVIWFTEMLR